MSRADDKRARLREGMASERAVVAIGAHDALTSHARRPTTRSTRSGSAASAVATMAYAIPDVNLTTMNETLDAAVRSTGRPTCRSSPIATTDSAGSTTSCARSSSTKRAGIAAICDRGQPVPQAQQPARRRHQARAAPDGGAGAPVQGRQGGPGDRRLRASSPASRRSSPATASRTRARAPDAYVDAGVDAILIHSRDKTLGEIEGFLGEWKGLGTVPARGGPDALPDVHGRRAARQGLRPGDPGQPADARGGAGRSRRRSRRCRASGRRPSTAHRARRPHLRPRRYQGGDRARGRGRLA